MLPDILVLPSEEKEVVKAIIEVYHDKVSGKVSQEFLQEACCYWAFDHAMHDLRCRLYPTMPMQVENWNRLTKQQKEAADDHVRDRIEGMKEQYRIDKIRVHDLNKSNFFYLTQMLSVFEKRGDLEKELRVKEVLNEYCEKLGLSRRFL